MQKRANTEARIVKGKQRTRRNLAGLTLALIAAGGLSVSTMNQCNVVAKTQVDAMVVRHGPSGTAARLSAPSDGSG
jgi:hypothetical protein